MKITAADLRRLCPKADAKTLTQLAVHLPAILPGYGINNDRRFVHFIAQAAHETMGFATLEELGGKAYFDKNYGPQTRVGRRLGNTEPGDGARYHGRGIFQLTGRSNYRVYGKRIGVDLERLPERAAEVEVSVRVACEYWKAKGLNALADSDDVVAITERINGGHNGLAERKRLLAKAKAIWPDIDEPAKPAPISPAAEPEESIPDAPIALPPAPKATTSPTIIGAVTTVAGSGAFGVLSYIESPYALGAFAIVVAAALIIGFVWFRRRGAVGV